MENDPKIQQWNPESFCSPWFPKKIKKLKDKEQKKDVHVDIISSIVMYNKKSCLNMNSHDIKINDSLYHAQRWK